MLKTVDFSNAISFSRPGVKWSWGASGLLEKVPVDTPAFPCTPFQGGIPLGQLLEKQTLNLWANSSDASLMPGNSFTFESASSIFLTEQTCYKMTNTGVTSYRSTNSRYELLAGSAVRSTWTIIETTPDTAYSSIGLRDITQSSWCGGVQYTVSTGELEHYASNSSGTMDPELIGPYVLTDNGPNGGRVVLFGVATDGNPSSNVRGFLYPTGKDVNTDSVYVHHCQIETGNTATSPIVTLDDPLSRDSDVADLMVPGWWQNAPVGTFVIEFEENLSYGYTNILIDNTDARKRPFYFFRGDGENRQIRAYDGNTAPRIENVGKTIRAAVSWDENVFKIACLGQIEERPHTGVLTQIRALRLLGNSAGSILIKDLQFERALYSNEKLLEVIQ